MCPTEPSLPMKYEGIAQMKNDLIRYKFVCPKMKWVKVAKGKYKRQCYCENPCTSSSCGRMFYIYPEKIYVPILVFYVVQMSGMKLIKFVPL